MEIEENQRFSQEYHEPDKRSIANAIQIFYKDGTTSDQITVEYPIGHRRRREEGIPILEDKFARNLAVRIHQGRVNEIFEMCVDLDRLIETPVNEFMDKLVIWGQGHGVVGYVCIHKLATVGDKTSFLVKFDSICLWV